jgi:hypothetical protein
MEGRCRVWRKLNGGSEIKAHHVSRSCCAATQGQRFILILLFTRALLLFKWKRVA